MKWRYMKGIVKDICILTFFAILIFGPLLILLINSYRYNIKIKEINKKYDQIKIEIMRCQTMECVREKIGLSQ